MSSEMAYSLRRGAWQEVNAPRMAALPLAEGGYTLCSPHFYGYCAATDALNTPVDGAGAVLSGLSHPGVQWQTPPWGECGSGGACYNAMQLMGTRQRETYW